MIFDTAVVGGGINGMLTALCLLKQGERVVLLDKNNLGTESSWAGGGILSPLYPWQEDLALLKLSDYSQTLFPALCEEIQSETHIDPEYLQSGYMILEPGLESEWKAWAMDYCPKHIKHNDVTALELPWVAQVRNPRLIKGLKALLEINKLCIKENAPVIAFHTRKSHVSAAETTQEKIQAGRFVIATGAWTHHTEIPEIEVQINPVKGQMLLFYQPQIDLKQIHIKHNVYLIPRKDGHILAGSTVEDVGFDKTVTDEAREKIIGKAVDILPELEGQPPIKQWAGLRPRSKHGYPVIGPSCEFDNVFYNAGHYRTGVTLAPGSAELLVQQMYQQNTFMEAQPFQLLSH